MLFSVLPFVLIIVIFYFFMIRPQNKKQKEAEKMRNSIQKGDKIVTIGGVHGTVASVKERTFILKVEDGSRIEFDRSAISAVVSDRNAASKKEVKLEKEEQDEPKETAESAEGAESSSDSEGK
ncbi:MULTISPECIES: preprotein translocase subunit YajC [Treponema]|nr:preprotein translocase subunit YajC [Treponema sp.]